MKVGIIGAGASGLVCAINCALNKADVTIIDANKMVGKKLLLTGNGRCNYWNNIINIKKYYSNDLDILDKILENNVNKVLPFFDNLGIIPKVINDYYYPYSNQASSIVNALVSKVKSLNVKIKLEEKVEEIKKEEKFIVKTNKNIYQFDKVVMATGGLTYSKTGSLGFGYEIALKFGHKVHKLYPALSKLIGKDNFYKDLDGVRSYVKLSLKEDDQLIKEEMGEVQFTKDGISGICSFNLSGLINKGLSFGKKEIVYINFVPWFLGTKKEFKEWLDNHFKVLKDFKIKEVLEGFLNYKIVNLLVKLQNINNDSKWINIDQDLFIDYLWNFKIVIKDTGDFDIAQVTGGGVSLKEIDPLTLESKLVKNLYFTGEVLDVYGDCGGYNLGFAWISGIIVGEHIND